MVLANFTYQEFIDFLKDNDWKIVSDEHWEQFDFIMIGNGKESFPLQIKKTYFYMQVVDICKGIGVEPPQHLLRVYKQHKQMSSDSDE